MNKSNLSELATVENAAFLFDGFGTIVYGFGIFFGVLILGTLALDFVAGLSDFGIRSVVFLLVVYCVLIFLTIFVIAFLRVRAVIRLKRNNEDDYIKFLKSNKKTKHKILGMLV